MVRKLIVLAALTFGIGVTVSAPAPAIEFICTCARCTTSTSNLGCRDYEHGGPFFTSCGAYHTKYCS